MSTKVRVTYADGTSEVLILREAAFGIEGTAAHGPVLAATLVGHEDLSDGSSFPHHTRYSRSMQRGVPVYGTGQTRP